MLGVIICSSQLLQAKYVPRILKGYGNDSIDAIIAIYGGGAIIAGNTDIPGSALDFFIAKIYPNGSVQWQKAYGFAGCQYAYAIDSTNDGGYIIAGSTDNCWTNSDIWIVRIDVQGNILWQKS